MKMYTRSSSRQTQKQNNYNSKHEELLERPRRQIREPMPHIFFSDDSEDDTRTVKDKSSNKKIQRRVTKSKITSSDESDNGSRTRHVPSSSKQEQLLQDKLLLKKTTKRVTKPDIIFIDDSDDECRSLSNQIPKLSTPRKQKLRSLDHDLNQVNYASPPKQKKTTDVSRTPTHNKIVQKEEVQTPSRLLLRLKLTSPTHSNGVIEKEKGSNRKELFKEKEKISAVENGEHFGETNVKKNVNFYRNARKALHTSYPTDMPGREKELNELKEFIETHIENKTSGSLYISGPPGTGKTASLNIILQDDIISSKLHKVYINCTGIKSANAIYSRIGKEFGIKMTGKAEKDSVAVENYLRSQSKMILLVLDEIDQLESKNQSILYTIFEWPSKPNSHLILVGIANALDLTDRKLCRLQGHYKLKPKLMHFAPYTKQQILQIFTSRLKSAGVLEVFSPPALQILAGKFAAGSGDIRRALDIGRRAVELIDQSNKEDVLKPVENFVGKAEKEAENKLKSVEVKQVVNVLNNIYGTSQNLVDEPDNAFPLQQKIIICSLVLMLKKARNKDITVGKLHEVYKRVCTKRNILNVDQAEFVGLCSLIETRGIIRVTGKKEPRLNKVNLEWDEEEVASALKDKQLMSAILQDESCLGKL
ncbi:cell division control protein 6 homolog [Anoplophora glabripennis]|uniref:cell division control protein 6 homolog n=1 Tax=Anoplophora glabripennis TaxID=217634 RepID=UPI000873F578|nr:cell division control protein 6 homolog [Anoplophora glabripennis]